nr:hypothetical protein TetV2_00638 [Oceanusvirus sp.]
MVRWCAFSLPIELAAFLLPGLVSFRSPLAATLLLLIYFVGHSVGAPSRYKKSRESCQTHFRSTHATSIRPPTAVTLEMKG